MLTIALPKGRVANDTLEVFKKIFNRDFEFQDRKLILEVDNFKFLLVRSQDVASYVSRQAADLGIVGNDVLQEKDYTNLVKLFDLKIGKCDICIGIQGDRNINYSLPEIKIATKMEKITRKHFSSKAISVDIIKLYGSIELAPIVGLSDAIVDLVETGDTMRQNGLKVVEKIGSSTAHLVSNKLSYISKKIEILNLIDNIKNSYSN